MLVKRLADPGSSSQVARSAIGGSRAMSIRRLLFGLSIAVSSAALAAAPVAKDQLLKPPADAEHFVVVSEAGKHGDEWRWKLPDGSVAFRAARPLRGLASD